MLSPNSIPKLAADIAYIFSTSATYYVDDYVIYEGELYKTIAEHTGAWEPTHFTKTVVSDEFDNYKVLTDSINTAYNIANTYYVGDVVSYKGKLYVCISNEVTGAFDSTKWHEYIYNITENNYREVNDETVLAGLFKAGSATVSNTNYNIYCSGSAVFQNDNAWGENVIVNGNGNTITIDWKNNCFYKATFNNVNFVITSSGITNSDNKLFDTCVLNNCNVIVKPELFNNNSNKAFYVFTSCTIVNSVMSTASGTITKNTNAIYKMFNSCKFADSSVTSNVTSTEDANGAQFILFEYGELDNTKVNITGSFSKFTTAKGMKINNSKITETLSIFQSSDASYTFLSCNIKNSIFDITINNSATTPAETFTVFSESTNILDSKMSITTNCSFENLFVFNEADDISRNTIATTHNSNVGVLNVFNNITNTFNNNIFTTIDTDFTATTEANVMYDSSRITENTIDIYSNATGTFKVAGIKSGTNFTEIYSNIIKIDIVAGSINEYIYAIYDDVSDENKIENNNIFVNNSVSCLGFFVIYTKARTINDNSIDFQSSGMVSGNIRGIAAMCSTISNCNVNINYTATSGNRISGIYNYSLADGYTHGSLTTNCKIKINTTECSGDVAGVIDFSITNCFIELHTNYETATGSAYCICCAPGTTSRYASIDYGIGNISHNTCKFFVEKQYPATIRIIVANPAFSVMNNDVLFMPNCTDTIAEATVNYIYIMNKTDDERYNPQIVVSGNILHHSSATKTTTLNLYGIRLVNNTTSDAVITDNILTYHRFYAPSGALVKRWVASTAITPTPDSSYHNIIVTS